MSECSICCSSFSSKLRKEVKCNSCQYICCAKCIRTYLMGLTSDAKCMNCNVEWSIPFLHDSISKNFLLEFKKHRREYLFQKQLYLLPILSEYIEYEKELKQLQQEKKNVIFKIKSLSQDLKKEKQELEQLKHELYTKIQVSRIDKETIYNNFVMEGQTDIDKRRNYVRHCPCITENCRGFLNKQGQCPICNVKVCVQCNISLEKHEQNCDPNDVETFKEIQKNTRPCPKCSVPIFKISGCDQMWCTGCNTAFSWKTGMIDSGPVHNPHYFDWLVENQTQPTETLLVDDDTEENQHTLPSIRSLQNLRLNQYNYIIVLSHYRDLEHLMQQEIPIIQTSPREYRRYMFEIMYCYISKNKDIQRNLDNVETNFALRKELMVVVENFRQQQIHLFRGLSISKTLSITEFMEYYQNNINFYNSLILKLSKSYGWYYSFQFQKSVRKNTI